MGIYINQLNLITFLFNSKIKTVSKYPLPPTYTGRSKAKSWARHESAHGQTVITIYPPEICSQGGIYMI